MKVIIDTKVRACTHCGERLLPGDIVWQYPLPAHWDESETERAHLACHRAYSESE